MTQRENRAETPANPKWMDGVEEPESGGQSPERTRAANEVGSAIVHQLNGPLTALRLYVGEIRLNGETPDSMHQMVEGAFEETERICAMMRMIADGFESPLCPETSAARGRDVISWWSRSAITAASGDVNGGVSIHTRLTPREREVLDLVSQGCSNKQGAIRMRIGPRTFESHRARVMKKLGARNAADLVRMALGELR